MNKEWPSDERLLKAAKIAKENFLSPAALADFIDALSEFEYRASIAIENIKNS